MDRSLRVLLAITFSLSSLCAAQTVSTLYVTPSTNITCRGEPCLTLNQYAVNASQYFTDDTELVFLPGRHLFSHTFVVSNISFTMQGNHDNNDSPFNIPTEIFCSKGSSIVFRDITSRLSVKDLIFLFCGDRTLKLGVLVSERVNSFFLANTIINNSTTAAVWLSSSAFYSSNNKFYFNYNIVPVAGDSTSGGALSAVNSVITFVNTHYFVGNIATVGGSIAIYKCTIYFLDSAYFTHNIAGFGGAVYSEKDGEIYFLGKTSFLSNTALISGGAMFIKYSKLSFHDDVIFKGNSKSIRTGTSAAMWVTSSNVSFFRGATFSHNGPVLFDSAVRLHRSICNIKGDIMFINNFWSHSAVLNLVDSSNVSVDGTITIGNNFGSQIAISLHNRSTLIINGTALFKNIITGYGQGTLYVIQSTVWFLGETLFINNTADNGGAIYAVESSIKFTSVKDKNITFQHNTAYVSGGALYLIKSELQLTGTINFVNNTVLIGYATGGAIFASSSEVQITGTATFTHNRANLGGALYLEYSAQVSLAVPSTVVFEGNRAEKGGAVYVSDDTNTILCIDTEKFSKLIFGKCFFYTSASTVQIVFDGNTAQYGLNVFGGMLNKCSLGTVTHIARPTETGISQLQKISRTADGQPLDNSTISSEPLRLCFCPNGMDFNCDYNYPAFSVIPGETITLLVVAVDQISQPVTAVVRSYFPDRRTIGGFRQGQSAQEVTASASCSSLNYTVLTSSSVTRFSLYVEGPCQNSRDFQKSISINLQACPIAFEISHSQCICDRQLQAFTNSCNIDRQSFSRTSKFWVGTHFDDGGLFMGLILYPYCPLDYCITGTNEIGINNLDSQCASNRRGVLCGSCQGNLSLLLGSSHCMECSNSYLALLIPFAAAGIVLVVLLFLLRLTVSVGTLSGLIFFVNIVAVNRAIFFPPGATNVLTVFIAWLNLDLGIEICFFSGMDAYGRTWLQFVFPIYICFLVFIIIIISHYSVKVPRLLGRNPMSVLTTLFLLSYAKILRTVITAFSAVSLHYPNNTTQTVWLYDGNVRYLRGKHIPLFAICLLLLLFLFLPYTVFLFLGQWLQVFSNKKVLYWMNNLRIKVFLDTYYAPYQDKHRYWPGLLLLVRCALFLVFASNTSGEPSTNLFAISFVCLGLTTLTSLFGRVHFKLSLDILEGSFILNLGVLAAATHHVMQAGGNQAAVTYLSVSIAFTEFLGIVMYHSYLQMRGTKIWMLLLNASGQLRVWLNRARVGEVQVGEAAGFQEVEMDQMTVVKPATPSVTFVDLRESLLESMH